MTHGPIQPELHEVMNAIGRLIDETLNPDKKNRKWGFTLLMFELNTHEGRMNYLSNAAREDMLTAMKELIANFEGRVPPANKKGQ
jgi:hypothetical protein